MSTFQPSLERETSAVTGHLEASGMHKFHQAKFFFEQHGFPQE